LDNDNTAILDHAAGCFHPALLSILYNIAEAPRPLSTITTVYDSGAAFGRPWPLIHIVGGPCDDTVEYCVTVTPDAPDALTISRVPNWPNGMPEIALPLDDPALIGRTLWLTNWDMNCLDCDLPCWGTPEEKARLRAKVEEDRDEA
jgi:hypothetical protein